MSCHAAPGVVTRPANVAPRDSGSLTLDEKAVEVSAALMPVIERMVKAEAEKIAARPQPVQVRMDRMEVDIMRASRAVAQAADKLREAQFVGAREAGARANLVKAADRLHQVMKKYGRV